MTTNEKNSEYLLVPILLAIALIIFLLSLLTVNYYPVMLMPSLLIPYTILFRRRKCTENASFIAAIVCGILYAFLILYAVEAISKLSFISSRGFLLRWVFYSIIALLPGVVFAYVGTLLSEGARYRSRKTE